MLYRNPKKEVHKRIAKEDVVLIDYVPLIKKIVSSYARTYGSIVTDNMDDLTQEGYIGLIKAEKTYDPERGTFVTHAYRCATSEINKRFKKYVEESKRADLSVDSPSDTDSYDLSRDNNEKFFLGGSVDYEFIGRMLNHEHRKLYWCLYNNLNMYKTCAICDIPFKDYKDHIEDLKEEIMEILNALEGGWK